MKSLKSLISERDLLLQNDLSELSNGEISKIKKRLQLLKNCIRYLETSPSEDFIRTEIEKLSRRVELIKSSFVGYIPVGHFKNEKEVKRFYNKEMGLTRITNQLKTLRFIAK